MTAEGGGGGGVGGGGGGGAGYKIPQELQEVLLDFTVQYLVEQPEDLASFAVVYFSRLKARQPASASAGGGGATSDGQHSDESMESEDEAGARREIKPLYVVAVVSILCNSESHYNAIGGRDRRKSVFAEAYDPEEEDDDEATVRYIFILQRQTFYIHVFSSPDRAP